MRSKRSRKFRDLFFALPDDVRKQAYAAYRLFRKDPFHTSLHFKRVSPNKNLYSVRIGIAYRALGLREKDDEIVWLWIGSHTDSDKLLKG